MAVVMHQATPRLWPKWGSPGTPGNDRPIDVEIGAGQVVLIEDVGRIERPMGVAGEQWRATGRPVTVEHPTITATIQLL